MTLEVGLKSKLTATSLFLTLEVVRWRSDEHTHGSRCVSMGDGTCKLRLFASRPLWDHSTTGKIEKKKSCKYAKQIN